MGNRVRLRHKIHELRNSPLTGKSIGVLFLRVLGVLLFFSLTLFLTNNFDPVEVGKYDFSRSLLIFLGTLAVFGMQQSIIYYSGFLMAKEQLGAIKRVYFRMVSVVLGISILLVLGTLLLKTSLIEKWLGYPIPGMVFKTVWAIFFYGVTMLNIDAFRAIHKIYLSEVFRNIFRYLFFFIAVIVLFYGENSTWLVEAYLLNFAFLAIISTLVLWRQFGKASLQWQEGFLRISHKEILKRSAPMAVSAASFLLMQSLDVLMLTSFTDYETVALIAGGHTFGKAHGAADPEKYVAAEPAGASIEAQSKGWINSYKSGFGDDTITSGLEGAWTPVPNRWDHDYFRVLLDYEWERTKSPAGAHQWKPTSASNASKAPMAHDPSKTQDLMMTTADIALKTDPAYLKISKHFRNNPAEFEDAFARAWFKLLHRDMGPVSRYLGPEVPKEELLWQDPIPVVNHTLINEKDIASLKGRILDTGLSISELVTTAWASASTYRGSDMRGGANGGRIRLEPQKNWEVNNPQQLSKVLDKLETIQKDFNSNQTGDKQVSMADLIVLGGCAAIEKAARAAGQNISVPFTPGRGDSSLEQTEVDSFKHLEPAADGFRNYLKPNQHASFEELLVDKSQLLTLTVPEMTVLVGGMRVLDTNWDGSSHGVFTDKPETLTNDFFVNLLDLGTTWKAIGDDDRIFEGRHRASDTFKWTGTRADLIFGSNSELRAIAEVYASEDSKEKFVKDFVKAWSKVMDLDRFDLK